MRTIEVACLVHVENGQLLLIESKKNPGIYYMPGGKIEPGETAEQALVRELQEELNITIDPATIRHFGDFRAQAVNQPDGVDVHNHCFFASFTGTPQPAAEIATIQLFTKAAYLAAPRQAPAVLKILDALAI
ncbi:NUDIX domain-containing protein [Chitinophaga pendula]|uniref:NUDIX hydrolase n=1 Tax=Chitinophaga TaxID=79328 RepID=UPI000BB0A0C8|nr:MULTISPECIES: NUDIX domain-containing protein [Chitinophaga]ASZ12860.1 DNA mismatch repair protein MutT [Chitinophaga sp. MD30]UCJ09512.1 NUDIX domain-containing protein [Chitinophaga pendula]